MYEWLSVVFSSFILEDPTTIVVATQVHDGKLTWLAGGTALFVGILVGDISLYVLGYLARVGVIRKDMSHMTHPVTGWYIFGVRFVPGLRVIVYTTAGFFKYPFAKFVLLNSLSVLVWSILLIIVGNEVYKYTGWWGVGGVVALIIAWQLIKRWRAKRRADVVTPNVARKIER